MKPITPYLWFDKEAREAAQFYCSILPNSKITSIKTISNTPSGDCDIVAFELNGQPFMAISAGPHFKFNESISFMVSCETQAEIDRYWEQLSAVPAAEQCGWLKDKYGFPRLRRLWISDQPRLGEVRVGRRQCGSRTPV
jgi:predicted 3-demethylubiquinone-9 3-methyltransferase (glyoxalase superfamily)